MSDEKNKNNVQDNLDPNLAGILLQSIQQLRVHWSGIIISVLNYTIIFLVAIWSYFLKAYFEAGTGNELRSKYIAFAAASSAFVLGLWRWYTHYIDNRIAELYPDFLRYEWKCGIEPGSEYGTSGYLKRAVPGIKDILCHKTWEPTDKIKGIRILVERGQAGSRGHSGIDLFAVVYILGMLGVTLFIMGNEFQSPIFVGCLLAIAAGFCFVAVPRKYFQKNPSERCIKDILSGLN